MRNGFALIDLMFVSIGVLIVPVVIFPNMLQSRIKANEGVTIAILRVVGSAQLIFQARNFGRHIPGIANDAGFSPNYRNLYYAYEQKRNSLIALINQREADAAVDDTGGSHVKTSSIYQVNPSRTNHYGYLFGKPNEVEDDWFQYEFGLLAVPTLLNNTGKNIFCLTADGSVWKKHVIDMQLPTAGTDLYYKILKSPASGAKTGWERL
jgi:hypothetical protein